MGLENCKKNLKSNAEQLQRSESILKSGSSITLEEIEIETDYIMEVLYNTQYFENREPRDSEMHVQPRNLKILRKNLSSKGIIDNKHIVEMLKILESEIVMLNTKIGYLEKEN
jgi:hypothetical protein